MFLSNFKSKGSNLTIPSKNTETTDNRQLQLLSLKDTSLVLLSEKDENEVMIRQFKSCIIDDISVTDVEIAPHFEKTILIFSDLAALKALQPNWKFEPGIIFRRSFLRSAKAFTNFGEGTIIIQPDFDPFLLSRDEEGNPNFDDLEMLLDFDEIPQIETDLLPMVCKMGKGSQNKKKIMENIMYFNNGARPSLSVGTPLTKEEAKKWALAHSISMRYEML
uniref:Uncharacterized protein n=1 Tax=Tanacetum cinerariifolium TaxID=118510 RepID=A0A6L2J3P0_TANCI|nr:hypothetical protein [Tanacetum cinerariifolium]